MTSTTRLRPGQGSDDHDDHDDRDDHDDHDGYDDDYEDDRDGGDVRSFLRRYRLWIALVAAVVLVAVGVWVVVFSSVFGVRSVDVRGGHLLTATQVRAAADITDGTPLVRVDTADVTRRVERLPEVATAQVSTSFPSTVEITIIERRPVGYLSSQGLALLVDRTGTQFRSLTKAPAGLPRLVVSSGPEASAARAAVASVAAALPSSLLDRLSSIQAQDATTVTLVLHSGTVVRWGSGTQNAAKARVLPTLLHRKNVSEVDVTNPELPFTR